jgi:hypothetical protein
MMIPMTAFLIISCDKYAELWDTHFNCLDEHWADCPFPKYILTNHKDSLRSDVTAIKVGDDLTWSANLKKALKILHNDYDYVLVTFDDLFLVEKVNGRILHSVLESFHSINGQFLQLIKWHNKPVKLNSLLGLIEPGSLYRPNCVFSLWNIEVLDSLLLPEENAWQFEKNGSARSDRYNGFYVVLSDVFRYRNTVVRGKILRKDARQFHLAKTEILSVMDRKESLQFYLRYWGLCLFLFLVPRKHQVKMGKIKNRVLGRKA